MAKKTQRSKVLDDLARQYRPLASAGLTSYRLRGRYGWIMIGALDHENAMREAARSTVGYAPDRTKLEIWNGSEYVNAGLPAQTEPTE